MDLTFFREPSSVREVFHPYGLWNLDVPSRIAQEVFVDNFGNIVFIRDEASRYQYDVRFGPMNPSAFDGMNTPLGKYLALIAELPKDTRRFYELSAKDATLLQSVPAAISSQPWFKEFRGDLSTMLTGPVGSLDSIPVATILHNTQKYFRKHYKASLRVDFKGDSNLKDFMGAKKEGHCELFATAAALYLRSLGIPVRLVSGYMGGQFNFVSHMLEVPE
ncbi:MAG: transglutaminase domain-containing protein, partial [Proteobacteria bacterium]|nr:transglutaminase domain-containing protein [Pseudomonadota bacterium]